MVPSVNISPSERVILDAVELFGELTADMDSLSEIPRVLVSLLPVDRVSFILFRQVTPNANCTLVSAGCDAHANVPVESLPVRASQNHYSDSRGSQNTGTRGTMDPGQNAVTGSRPRPMEYVRQLDDHHRMILSLHLGKRLSSLTDEFTALLDTICDTLVRSLRTLLAWREHPELLGGCFTNIKEKQWHIMCHLNANVSEKELAAVLQVPRNTLHSHIKDIYLMLGVNSRLEAVHRLQQAVRRYRAGAREWSAGGGTDRIDDPMMKFAQARAPFGGAFCESRPLGRIGVAKEQLKLQVAGRS